MLGRAGLVVVATSVGEPVVVDRQLRADATVLAVGRIPRTRGCAAGGRRCGDRGVEGGAYVGGRGDDGRGGARGGGARSVAAGGLKTVGIPWEDLAVARVVGGLLSARVI